MTFLLRSTLLAATSAVFAGPSAAATLNGLWLFDNPGNIGQATVGTDLAVNGTAPAYSVVLADDLATSQSGVITTQLGVPNGFTATHGIAPNGGGAFVNEYSVVVDLFSPAASRGSWRTIFQTNTANTNDGEYFIRNDNDHMGTASLTYSTNAINETAWTRLILTFDLNNPGTTSSINAYTNGSLFFAHANTSADVLMDGRFSLDPTILFFRDQDGDNGALNIGALAIYNGVLSPAEVAALGVAGSPIPEPGAAGLAALAAACIGQRRRRR